MISKQELIRLISQPEDDRLGKTVSVNKAGKFGEAICAFANDIQDKRVPGYLLIGVNDNGSLNGLNITESNKQFLMDFRTNGGILPPPDLYIEQFEFPEGDVLVVEVFHSDDPPVAYKGRIWIRPGARRAIANKSEEHKLNEKRSYFAASFDSMAAKGAKLEDIRLTLFEESYLPFAVSRDILEANNRSTEERLASLRFYDTEMKQPTKGAMVMFGLDPRRFVPGAFISYAKFDGKEITDDILFEKEFNGDLLTTFSDLDQFVKVQIIKRIQRRLGEPVSYNYPYEAIKELLFNALIHRNYQSNSPVKFFEYEDRIEITNPGGLYGDARPENFPRVNDYRNPTLAAAAKVLGHVNQFNRGITNAKKALADNGNPDPEFEFTIENQFGVTIYSTL